MREFYTAVDAVKDALRANNSTNTVTFGDLSDIDLDKTTIFPLSHIFVERVRNEDNMLIFDFSVLVADIVDFSNEETEFDDFFGNDNLHDVLNTQLTVINSLITSLRRGDLYRTQYQLDNEPIAEPFKERFKNLLAGWEATISIRVKNNVTIC